MESLVYNGISTRIDSFLSSKFGYSRNFFHHIFERGGISVNGKIIKKSYSLKDNDKIEIDDIQRYLCSDILVESPDIDLDIMIEKDDYLVIYKPKGVLSHPGSIWDIKSPNVVGFVFKRYQSLPSIGNFIRAGLIHRLDKETDGFMIIAKTETGLTYFKSLFQQKSESIEIEDKEKISLKKYYVAIVENNDKFESLLENFTIKDGPYYLIKDVIPKIPYKGTIKQGITKIIGLKSSSTYVGFDFLNDQLNGSKILENLTKLIDGNIKYAFIFMEILTGRTHQIRFHLSSIGLPVIGDYLYGGIKYDNMLLSSYRLEFKDPNGEYIIIK